jgi:metal-responsive CopG/Arc/MetJ family transcriptional regulator
MAIGKDKTRIVVTLTKELKEDLEKLAEAENRNVSNLINTILINYVKDNKKD